MPLWRYMYEYALPSSILQHFSLYNPPFNSTYDAPLFTVCHQSGLNPYRAAYRLSIRIVIKAVSELFGRIRGKRSHSYGVKLHSPNFRNSLLPIYYIVYNC